MVFLQLSESGSGVNEMAKTFVQALWGFETDREDELSFQEGDIMEVLDDSDDNWWEVW